MIRPPRTSKVMSQRRRVRPRHRDALHRHVAAVVDGLGHRRVEEERQVRAGEQQDDERVQRDLAHHERPVVGEDLVQLGAHRAGDVEPVVEPLRRPCPAACAACRPRGCGPCSVALVMAAPRSRGRSARGNRTRRRSTAARPLPISTPERQLGQAAAWPARTPAWRPRAPRTATGGTGRAAGWSAARTARPGSRRACRSWRTRRTPGSAAASRSRPAPCAP